MPPPIIKKSEFKGLTSGCGGDLARRDKISDEFLINFPTERPFV
jgi:hypothetical protein